MKRFLIIAIAVFALSAGLFALQTAPAFADAKSEVCSGIGAASGSGDCEVDSGSSINGLITTVVNILSLLVGIVAVIMIIVSGYRYITSGGESNKIASAKNTLVYAVVGLAIAALAQVIVKFVISEALK